METTRNKPVRILQYNILADGLSDDGFVCSSSLTTIDGDIHTIPEFLSKIQNVKDNRSALNVLANLYDTVENNQIYSECLEWNNRWKKITDLIQKYDPDIIVFQEMDHYGDAVKDMKILGYSSTYRHVDESYFPLGYNPKANPDTYLSLLNEQSYAFIPKLNSKARLFSLKKGVKNPDDDGCAIFWKTDRFDLRHIYQCQFYKYQSNEKDEDGAMAVVLADSHTDNTLCIITTHLPSGQTRERELERLEILSDSDRGVFRKFIVRMIEQYPRTVIALDANSDPLETYSDDGSSDNVWKRFHEISNLRSVWDSYFNFSSKANIVNIKGVRPVTVNKIRGPKSNQPNKIGIHSYELIDHIFYSGLEFDRFVIPVISFDDNKGKNSLNSPDSPDSLDSLDSLSNLIPNQNEPSDHYPVIVDLY